MKIAVVGCGNMGRGIAIRLSQEHLLKLYDHKEIRSGELAKQIKGKTCKSLDEAIEGVEMIILAVKPKNLNHIAAELHKKIGPSQMLVSILAGTPLSQLKQHFPGVHLVRLMPNLAVFQGKGIVAIAESEEISSERKIILEDLFALLGKVYWFPEEMFDAFTSLTASGPGFVFVLIEAMVDAAIAMGFTATQGKELVIQMLDGSLSILQETGRHPAELKWQVASPGGMTIVGLSALESSSVRSGIMNAFLTSFQKAKHLHRE